MYRLRIPCFLLSFLLLTTSASAEIVTIKKVIDGQTLKLKNGRTVRLIGIQAIESPLNRKAKLYRRRAAQNLDRTIIKWKEATEFLEKLDLEGTEVRLDYDLERLDNKGRLLGYVYLQACTGECTVEVNHAYEYKRFNDGTYIFLNATLIKTGYAQPKPVRPNTKYAELFRKLFIVAKVHKRGIWAKVFR